MRRSHIVIKIAIIALFMSTLAPAAFAWVRCSCDFCVPGNLSAKCYWPGNPWAYCVDYWEFNCMIPGGGPNFAVADISSTEPELCNELTEDEFILEITEPEADKQVAIEAAEGVAIEPAQVPLTPRS